VVHTGITASRVPAKRKSTASKRCDDENDDTDAEHTDTDDVDERALKRARKPSTSSSESIRSALQEMSSNQQLLLRNQTRLLTLFESLLGLAGDKETRNKLLALAPSAETVP